MRSNSQEHKKLFMSSVILLVALSFCHASNELFAEEKNTGWSLYFDNDFFALGTSDNDYTGGFALKLSGTRVKTSAISIDGWLDKIDDITGFRQLSQGSENFSTHSMEMGLTLFTPEDLNLTTPIDDQHPYSSLFFINNTRMSIIPDIPYLPIKLYSRPPGLIFCRQHSKNAT